MAGRRSLTTETVPANESHLSWNVEPSCLNALGRKILRRKVIFTRLNYSATRGDLPGEQVRFP